MCYTLYIIQSRPRKRNAFALPSLHATCSATYKISGEFSCTSKTEQATMSHAFNKYIYKFLFKLYIHGLFSRDIYITNFLNTSNYHVIIIKKRKYSNPCNGNHLPSQFSIIKYVRIFMNGNLLLRDWTQCTFITSPLLIIRVFIEFSLGERIKHEFCQH